MSTEEKQDCGPLALKSNLVLGPLVEAAGMVNVLNHGSGSCVYSEGCHGVTQEHLERFAEMVRADERERICAAIKAEDDHCADGDYMLDSDDCIKVARGQWKRPDWGKGPNAGAKRAPDLK